MEEFQIIKDWGVKVTCLIFPYLNPKYYYFESHKKAKNFARGIPKRHNGMFLAEVFKTGV